MPLRRFALAAATAALAACNPPLHQCSDDASCGGGLVCTADGTCQSAPLTGAPDDWADARYLRRLRVVVDAGELDDDAAEVPVVVRVRPGDAGEAFFRAGATEVRAAADDGTTLAHDLVALDDVDGAVLYVKLPLVVAGASGFWLYYDREGFAGDGNDAAPGVWSGFTGAWHFEESGGALGDASDNDHAGQRVGGVAVGSGVVGNGQRFAAVEDGVAFADDAPFALSGSGFTVDVWARIAAGAAPPTDKATVILERRGAFTLAAADDVLAWIVDSGGGVDVAIVDAGANADGAWHHFALTGSASGSLASYVDGVAVGAGSVDGGVGDGGGGLTVGGNDFDAAFDVDELRVQRGEQTAAWVRASYLSAIDALTVVGRDEGL